MEYMRTLKVEEARRKLDSHPELTIEAIAFSCGFNIPSTFYRLFRKQYGISPTEYRKMATSQENKNTAPKFKSTVNPCFLCPKA